ncbi:hypothetical protein RF11_03725 [Thelohanellus kitauei]|uniref:Uncharacterized protein n=1 Tax=Thelohanellus kitauei TaxID=669202 RepID=A0A0C2IWD1_THEKT|nr:hypothetical protein RF11_03725 [Thelohanellus kitauei]
MYVQQSFFTLTVIKFKIAPFGYLKIVHIITKKKMHFLDAESLKESSLTGAICLTEAFSKKLQDLQLSDNTVTRRIKNILKDLQTQRDFDAGFRNLNREM